MIKHLSCVQFVRFRQFNDLSTLQSEVESFHTEMDILESEINNKIILM